MARTDTLTNFLTDVADAIRTKTGSADTIPAEDFDTEIENIPSGGGPDWSAIGYSGTPQSIIDGYNFAKEIYDNWDSTQTNLSSKFSRNRKIIFMPLVDTSNATDMSSMFRGCAALINVPLLNTSNVTRIDEAFTDCPIFSIPLIDTSKVTTMRQTFGGCNNLKNVPLLDTSSISATNGFQNTFNPCYSLTDESLDNILQMCINATSYPGTKTLKYLGFASYNGFPASRIQALPHYQDFIDAGWTIGY